MQFIVLRKADAETEAETRPGQQLIDDMASYNEKMVKAGVMQDGNGLKASRHGARVSFAKGIPTVVDGPFAETKELVAGYGLIEAGSLAEAIEWLKQWPATDGHGNVQLEIRPIITAEELGLSPEQAERSRKLRQQSAAQQQ